VRGRMACVAAVTFATLAVGVAPAGAQPAPSCTGELSAGSVARRPGPLMRFGIGPLVQAGQIGPLAAPAVPEQPARTHDALARLRPAGGAFVLRLNRFFWSDGEAGIRRYLALVDRFTSRGYLVELQVRYHPTAKQEGDIGAWTAFVREVVRRFGPNPRVIGLQVTNEVNFTISGDSSDGSFAGARDALVKGVIAAKDEATRRGYRRLGIGFNWAYRLDPASEESFWRSLRDRGGPAFARAVDWIGLDAYPGTVFPPAEATQADYRDGMVNAMSSLRCFARTPGIPASVPMKIEENGWPTFGARSWATQAQVLHTMVTAAHDFRGTYNVSDYRWFNLRDGDSASPQPFQHFGLLDSAYRQKPAFAAYRNLVARLRRPEPRAGALPRPRLSLRLKYRRGRDGRHRRCARGAVRASVTGRDRRLAQRARFRLGRRAVRRSLDRRPPLSRVVLRRHPRHSHRYRARVSIRLRDGRLVRRSRAFRACGRPR
jgi:hypothetical protein